MSDTIEIKKSHIAVVVAVIITVIVLVIGIGIGVLVSRDDDSEDAAAADSSTAAESAETTSLATTNADGDIVFGHMIIPASVGAGFSAANDYVLHLDIGDVEFSLHHTDLRGESWEEDDMIAKISADTATNDSDQVQVTKIDEINGFYLFEVSPEYTTFYEATLEYGGERYEIMLFYSDYKDDLINLLEQIEFV